MLQCSLPDFANPAPAAPKPGGFAAKGKGGGLVCPPERSDADLEAHFLNSDPFCN